MFDVKILPYILLPAIVAACSPYKKITLTASDRLTQQWHGATEAAVNTAYGMYKQKSSVADGYLLSFDYSYTPVTPYQKPANYQVSVSRQRSITEIPRPAERTDNHPDINNLVVRRIDFYFDKTKHVEHVQAVGFPDSVYYVKRK